MINLVSRINRRQIAFILALLVAWLLVWNSGAIARAPLEFRGQKLQGA
jgi:hypothetical protein